MNAKQNRGIGALKQRLRLVRGAERVQDAEDTHSQVRGYAERGDMAGGEAELERRGESAECGKAETVRHDKCSGR